MFQIEPHLWLQSLFDASWMLPLMTAVSALGYTPAYLLLIAVCAFGLRLRPGLAILLAVLLMSGATTLVKQGADLPRPSDVDARVLDKGRSGHELVEHGGAVDVWSLPSDTAIAAFRAQPERDPGFLSGHTGVATAACVALLLGFGLRRWRWRLLLVLGWPALMALSRMYLGRHFVADVLAGWLLGIGVAVLAVALLPAQRPARHDALRLTVITVISLMWVALARQSAWIGVDTAGQLLGLAITLVWLHWRGEPTYAHGAWPALGRASLFVIVNLLASPLITGLAQAVRLPMTRPMDVLCYAVGTVLVMVSCIELIRLQPLARLQAWRLRTAR